MWTNGRNSVVKIYDYLKGVSKYDCEEIIKGMFEDQEYRNIRVDLKNGNFAQENGMLKGDFDAWYTDCNGEYFHDHYGQHHKDVFVHIHVTIVAQKKNGQVNLENKTILLPHGVKTDFNKGKDFDYNNGYTFWNTEMKKSDCNGKHLFLVYEGRVNKTVEIMPNNMGLKTTYLSLDED